MVFGIIINFTSAELNKEVIVEKKDDRAERIDAYFAKYNMPLKGYGKNFVEAADKNGIDWRLLAAISVRESSGGLHMLPNSYNPLGWGSGSIKFNSFEEAINYVSDKLGNGKYYKNKSIKDKLDTYNPPSICPDYSESIMNIMKKI